ncbi:MAG: metallophosphoesterase [Verrucomicrobia bacterium GWF2_51_19]|nr:MAG: metallophosphoesterase [Verrucomicrobia bacterium GWF2_51_19]HCJ11529.1 TIGR00282 family metallophosphoesterase [Opitutae bacterium]
MQLLFLGDIVGRSGREVVKKQLPQWRSKGVDFVFANGENAAHGFGITKGVAHELRDMGIDALTTGNHVWDQRSFLQDINDIDFVCLPANLPTQQPGRRHMIVERNGKRVGLFCLLGQAFMADKVSCPFEMASKKVAELAPLCDAIVVDFHAEATAEKMALGWHLDGKVDLIVGTHTHIPTADARLLPKGTAYITDIGMCGSYDSILGFNYDTILQKALDGLPRKHTIATENLKLSGVLVSIGKQNAIQLIF